MTLKNYRAPLLHYIKLCVSSETPWWIQTGVTDRKCSIRVKIGDFFVPCDLEIKWMTLKNNRASLLCNIKLCASMPSVNSNWSYSPEMPNLGQNRRFFLSRVTLEFYGWPWKTIGYLFYVASSFLHHFITIGEFKITLVRKRSIRVKIGDLLSCVTLKFDGWPWKTILHLFYVSSNFMHHFIAIGEFKLKL